MKVWLLQGSEDMLRMVAESNQKLVVLVPDCVQQRVQRICGAGATVLGIREAKGLEFEEVCVCDFFSALSVEQHKAWKDLVGSSNSGKTGSCTIRLTHPELETQLKLLYTGITRSQRTLLLFESRKTVAGSSFFRWIEARGLAEAQTGLAGKEVRVCARVFVCM